MQLNLSEFVAVATVYGPEADVPALTDFERATPSAAATASGIAPAVAAVAVRRARQPSVPLHLTRGGRHKASVHAVSEPAPAEVTLRLLLPNNMVGSIIGKGGATIKEITQQSGARIHINHNDDATMVERLVAVLGTYEQAVHAQRLIATRVQEEGTLRSAFR
jgi:polyribonucleotide nucleotidyltransferase